MTPKPDDRSLVDPRVADAWREASHEEPSSSVDGAILAAARREVSARPETVAAWEAREVRVSRRRWRPLAAAATIAAIAVGVLQLTPTDKVVSPATETATVSDMASPAPKPDAGIPASVPEPAPPPRTSPSTAPAESKQQAAASALVSTPDPFPAATKPESAAAHGQIAASPPAARPAPSRAETAGNVVRERDSSAREPAASPPTTAQGAVTAAPAPAPPLAKMAAAPATDSGAAEQRTKDRKPLPVADWIALIRRLRAEGETDEAARELAAFRVAHTDHEKLLPPDLRDWRPPEK